MKNARRGRHLFVMAAFPLLFACARSNDITVVSETSATLHNPDDAAAIGAAYHERIRLGLGSPFRTIEIAARDARLPAANREALLDELFERVESGDMYAAAYTLPAAHMSVVQHAIASARDPRIGELAVNLAYQLAVTEKSITPALQARVSASAALLRDRALSLRDAERVAAAADAQQQHAHTLVPAWRSTRALLVEQPLMHSMDADAQEDASRLAMLMIGGVRQAARVAEETREVKERELLPRDVAQRIGALQAEHARPPQSAVFIAGGARHEEELVADSALTLERAQRVAMALRPYAQEVIWYDGMPAPTHADLLARHGVRLTFDADIPAAWHAYYRALVATTLDDLALVLPGISWQGLTIEIAELAAGAGHLAYHDPRARLIRWAPATGSGSLAHELGHDIDWQIARRGYGRKAGYASEYARDVGAVMLLTRPDSASAARPVEVFARQFDWLVAARLAQLGRLNGHLTSVQHEWLTGHGEARPSVANMQSAKALAGMIGRAGRLTDAGRTGLERAVLAPELPLAVRAVRQLRFGAGAGGGGPRAARPTPELPQSGTVIDALSRAAGTSLRTDPVSPELVLTFTTF